VETKRYGAQSMTAPLREVLVKRPGPAFGRAFDESSHGFLHPVDLDVARRQHDALCTILAGLGVTVHELGAETRSPDLVYVFDPALIADGGAIPLRSGKPTRRGEERELERWAVEHSIPVAGRIEAPGAVDGGDTFWLRPDVFCIGRSLRTNRTGAEQLTNLIGGETIVFDVPYWRGQAELLHLLSVVSPVADDLAVASSLSYPLGFTSCWRSTASRSSRFPRRSSRRSRATCSPSAPASWSWSKATLGRPLPWPLADARYMRSGAARSV
jgi:dimethylargininase